jgi:hypothetical protein
LGVIAAELLFGRLAHPELPPQRRLLQAELVVRQSTGPCRTPGGQPGEAVIAAKGGDGPNPAG